MVFVCRGGPQSSLMFCTNGVLLRMLTQGEGLQVRHTCVHPHTLSLACIGACPTLGFETTSPHQLKQKPSPLTPESNPVTPCRA